MEPGGGWEVGAGNVPCSSLREQGLKLLPLPCTTRSSLGNPKHSVWRLVWKLEKGDGLEVEEQEGVCERSVLLVWEKLVCKLGKFKFKDNGRRRNERGFIYYYFRELVGKASLGKRKPFG